MEADGTERPEAPDLAVHEAVSRALAPFGESVADLALEYDAHGAVWFTRVTPRNPRAAGMCVAVERPDDYTLNVLVGRTAGEITLGAGQDAMERLVRFAAAVFAGNVRDVGFWPARALVTLEDGQRMTFGHVQPWWPGKWRWARRYASYAD